MNSITITGNLTKDAQTRQAGDQVVTSFSMADNGFEKGEKTTIFWDVSIWGKRAESMVAQLVKGAKVTVVGKMTVPTEKDGRFYLKMTASDFEPPARTDGGGAQAQQTTRAAAPAPSRASAPAPAPHVDDEIPF